MSRGPTVFESGVENVPLFVQNTDGEPITTLDHEAAFTVKYRRQDQAEWTTITKVAGTIGTATSSGFKHDEDGIYQLGLPAAAKEGGNWVVVKWSGTGIQTDQMLVPIHRFNHQSETTLVTEGTAAGQLPPSLRILFTGGLIGTVDATDVTPSATVFEVDGPDDAADDTYKDMPITFATGPLAGKTYFITDSEGTTANPNNRVKLTILAAHTAPGAGDAFKIGPGTRRSS